MTQDLLTTFIEANSKELLSAFVGGCTLAAVTIYENRQNTVLRAILAAVTIAIGFLVAVHFSALVTPIPGFIVGLIVVGTALLGVGLYSAVILVIMLMTERRQASGSLASRARNS